MLVSLRIENLAIIEEVTIDFHPGFNVLTGETGVGKSMVVNALGLLSGGKASSALLRTGAKEGTVEALFCLPDGREVVLRRVISSTGRGRSYVDGKLVSLAQLEATARKLMDIYGQDQHYFLRDPQHHLELLDEFGGLSSKRREYRRLFDEYRSLERRLQELLSQKAEAQRKREFLLFQIRELEAAHLDPAEEERLLQRRELLLQKHKVMEALATVQTALSGDEGALRRISHALRELGKVSSLDDAFGQWSKALEEARLAIEEVATGAEGYASSLEHDPAELEEVEARLHHLQRLKGKYGVANVAELLEFLEGLKRELAETEGIEEEIPTLRGKLEELAEEMKKRVEELSEGRRRTAEALSRAMRVELEGLGMPKVSFSVAFFAPRGETVTVGGKTLGLWGAEEGEFLFSANPGERPKPLAAIASGGELSRMMLALKGVSKGGAGMTLIFDEIDAGIGGVAAEAVGERLKALAQRHQVLCVTHLPQIASQAHHHLRVRKEVVGSRTVVRVEPIEGEERKKEIARMFAGTKVSEATLRHVEEMLRR